MKRESFINVPKVQNLILNAYIADMAKYTSDSESTKIRNAFLSMPAQLAKENRKHPDINCIIGLLIRLRQKLIF